MAITSFLSKLTPTALFLLVSVVLTIQAAWRIAYLYWFHPLAKYPGPFLAKFTNLYSAYYAYNKDLHVNIHLCHQKYGKFVRYGPNKLLVNTPRGTQDIYGFSKNVKKAKAYLPMVPEDGAWSSITMIDKKLHRNRRKTASIVLSDEAMKEFEPMVKRQLDLFCSRLSAGSDSLSSNAWSNPINISDEGRRLMLDLMGEFGFGQKIGMLSNPSMRFVLETLERFSFWAGVSFQIPLLRHLHLEDLMRHIGLSAGSPEWDSWSDGLSSHVLDRTIDLREKGRFSIFLEARDPITREAYTDKSLKAEGIFLFIAGSDTSATTLSALLFYITHYPAAYSKLVEEIRRNFKNIDDICSGPRLQSCHYLTACLTETLRLSPPTVGAGWREVETGGIEVDGEYLPAGVDVGSCIYALHHNPDHFFSAQTFIPERWISGEILEKKQVEEAYAKLNTFGMGPRSCIGRSMAMLQISLTVVRILWEYDIKLAEGNLGRIGEGVVGREGRHTIGEFQLDAAITSISEGPFLQFRERIET